MSEIEKCYKNLCLAHSDINEHIPTLYKYGKECTHITECGVRGVTSSWAFAKALKNNSDNKLVQVDLDSNQNVINFAEVCKNENVNVTFYQQSDLECPLEETDLLFIDTWHVWG